VVGLRPDRWAYVAVNHRHGPLGDAAYRRALSALWDREHFARDLHRGLATPIGAPPFAGLGPEPAGRERATRLMDEAGYRDGNADGVRDTGGKAFRHSLLVVAGARAAATEAQTFVLEARKAGVLIDLVTVDAATLLTRVRKGDFDLALMLWEGRGPDDVGPLFGAGGTFNNFGYRSQKVETTLDLLRRESGETQRTALLNTLGATLAQEQPVLFLYRFDVPALVAHRVHDVAAVGARIDLRRAWVEP
jgi:ABC-type transport system substrate-binding protein